jgi:hypothetical protein
MPRNLGISRQAAVTVCILAAVIALGGIGFSTVAWGVDDKSTPVLLSILGTISTLILGLVAALKSTEAADTGAKTHSVAELTATKTFELQQQTAEVENAVREHCGQICPSIHCPMRQMAGGHT